MVTLVKGANKKLQELVNRDNVKAFYYGICEDYTKAYTHRFITSLQMLITKLGISIAIVANGPQISYSGQSISYLCNTVLDSKNIEEQFEKLGINESGNTTKHTIKDQVVYLDKCVVVYNSMINLLVDKYRLYCLKSFIVKKDGSQPTKKEVVKSKKSKEIKDNSTASIVDEKVTLQVSMLQGNGKFVKGLFDKTEMLHFKFKVTIKNPSDLHINKINATFASNGHKTIIKLPSKNAVTDIELPTSLFDGLITADVEMEYRLSMFKTKKISASVAKKF